MAIQKTCQTCRHCETVQLPNESPWYFCANEETKRGPNPIGFVKLGSEACSLYSARHISKGKPAASGSRKCEQKTVIFVIVPPAEQAKEPLEHKLMKFGAGASMIIFIAEFLLSKLPPELRMTIVSWASALFPLKF